MNNHPQKDKAMGAKPGTAKPGTAQSKPGAMPAKPGAMPSKTAKPADKKKH